MTMFKKLLLLFVLVVGSISFAWSADTKPVDPDYIKRKLDEMTRENDARLKRAAGDLPKSAKVEKMTGSTAQAVAKGSYTKGALNTTTGVITEKSQGILSKIKVPASVPKTAKTLGKGIGGNLIAMVLYDMLGEAVDYVLDPENNQVIIKDKPVNDCKFYYKNSYLTGHIEEVAPKVCNLINNSALKKYDFIETTSSDISSYNVLCSPGSAIVRCGYKPEDKKVSLDTIASEIHKMAEENNKAAQDLLEKIAEERIQEHEFDDDIINAVEESNKTDDDNETPPKGDQKDKTTEKDDGKQTMPKDEEEDKTKDKEKEEAPKFELPDFCEWAKPVCDFIEWYKEEPELKPEQAPEKDIELKSPAEFDKPYLTASRQCPADIVKPFNTGFATHEIRFEMSPICQFAGTYMRPVIIFMAYIFAVIYIGGAFKVG